MKGSWLTLFVVNSPVNYLFNTVPLSILSQPSTGFDSSLKSYRSSLEHQLLGRTALLDSVLSTLEQCARHIHEEVSLMRSGSRNEAGYAVVLFACFSSSDLVVQIDC